MRSKSRLWGAEAESEGTSSLKKRGQISKGDILRNGGKNKAGMQMETENPEDSGRFPFQWAQRKGARDEGWGKKAYVMERKNHLEPVRDRSW